MRCNCLNHDFFYAIVKKIFLFLVIFSLNTLTAQEFSWSASAGSVGEDYGMDIAKDPLGNVYSTGYFSGILDINTGPQTMIISSNGSKDVFITKHNPNGGFLWAKKIGGNNAEIGNSIAVDDSSNVYVLGSYQGNVDFNPGVAVNSLFSIGNGTFLLKLNSNGDFVWVRDLQVTDPHSLSINPFQEIIFTSASFIGKIHTNGNIVWKKPSVALQGTSGSISNSEGGFIFVIDANLGGPISKLDSSGNVIWSKNLSVYAKSIIADTSENIYLTGFFGGTVDFDPGAGIHNLVSLGNKDVFVLKLDSSGSFVWAKNFGSSANFYDEGNSISFNGNDGIFITGTYGGGNNDFDPGPNTVSLPSGGGTEVFILKLDLDGNFVWVTSSAGNADDEPKSIVYSNNSVFLTGFFTSTSLFFDLVNFTDNLTSSGGNGDIFFAKIKDCLNTYSTLNITACGSYTSPSGNFVYNSSGVYQDTIANSTGCDSIIALNITIFPVYSILNPQTICIGNTYSINNHIYSSSGTYRDTLYTTLGCDSIIITQLNVQQLITISTTVVNPDCGDQDGIISANISTNNLPYTAVWSNGDTGNVADSLVAGQYLLQVVTNSGCINSKLVSLNSLTGPQIIQSTISNVTCYGESTGSINLNIISNLPYDLVWSNGQNANFISNLQAGIYDVILCDSSGCKTFAAYNVSEPNPLIINLSSTPAGCGISSGAATAMAYGGNGNYSYQWSATAGSQFSPIASNLFPGIYQCTVTDNLGCQTIGSVAVSSNPSGPQLSASISPAFGCRPGQGGSIDLQVSGGVSPYSFQWNSGQTTEDIYNLTPGNYTVLVSGANGCVSTFSTVISNSLMNSDPEICLVTVDSTTQTNRIFWEKPTSANGIQYYTVFRETSVQGLFLPVKVIPFDSLSEWTDPIANPQVRGWRYKISHTDSCGKESLRSPIHKTIHLTSNFGTGGVVNILWDNYLGFNYSKVYLWRLNGSSGWSVLDSLPSNLFSYTDLTPPTTGNLSYFLEAVSPQACLSSLRISINNDQIFTNIVKTRSNVKNNREAGVGIQEVNEEYYTVYPNPTETSINVHWNRKTEVKYSLLDNQGKNLLEGVFFSNTNLPLNEFSAGLYVLKFYDGKKVYYEKIVVLK